MPKLSILFRDSVNFLIVTYGLKIDVEKYDELKFGDAKLELSSDDIAIQLVRDRGQIFVNVKYGDSDWIAMETVLSYLKIHENVPLNEAALDVLLRHFEKIRQILLTDHEQIVFLSKKKRAEIIERFSR